jgi:ABC-type antimicrobial peptide transport system permease subunit
VLSAVGLYAVTAYSVTQRTPEIGVRMALGARSGQVMWLVVRRAPVQLAIGLPIGIAGAFGVGRLLQSLLVQTSARCGTSDVVDSQFCYANAIRSSPRPRTLRRPFVILRAATWPPGCFTRLNHWLRGRSPSVL